jgi:hypothetical protein
MVMFSNGVHNIAYSCVIGAKWGDQKLFCQMGRSKTILPNGAIKKLFCQMGRSKTILPNGAIYSCANWGDIRIMVKLHLMHHLHKYRILISIICIELLTLMW